MEDNFLTDTEKQSLEKLNESPTTIGAVRKVMLSAIYYDGTLQPGITPNPHQNFAFLLGGLPELPDEQVGKHLRSCIEGIRMLENGFERLKRYKKVESPTPKPNQAR